jgi:predicted secreted protein
MSITTALAIYFVIWWVVLFAVLPWGVRSQQEHGDVAHGTDPGAPALHRVWWKLLWTSLLSGVVFGLGVTAYFKRWITLDMLPPW